MAVSTIGIPKGKIGDLRNVPRDIFFTLENNDPGAAPGVTRVNYEILGGVGLDLDVSNAAAAAGSATVTIDKVKVVTLAPGARFTLENVLYSLVEIRRTVSAVACTVSIYHAGVSFEAME